jgi:hypothetical protein
MAVLYMRLNPGGKTTWPAKARREATKKLKSRSFRSPKEIIYEKNYARYKSQTLLKKLTLEFKKKFTSTIRDCSGRPGLRARASQMLLWLRKAPAT